MKKCPFSMPDCTEACELYVAGQGCAIRVGAEALIKAAKAKAAPSSKKK